MNDYWRTETAATFTPSTFEVRQAYLSGFSGMTQSITRSKRFTVEFDSWLKQVQADAIRADRKQLEILIGPECDCSEYEEECTVDFLMQILKSEPTPMED